MTLVTRFIEDIHVTLFIYLTVLFFISIYSHAGCDFQNIDFPLLLFIESYVVLCETALYCILDIDVFETSCLYVCCLCACVPQHRIHSLHKLLLLND